MYAKRCLTYSKWFGALVNENGVSNPEDYPYKSFPIKKPTTQNPGQSPLTCIDDVI